jgi:hypothetical protein
MHMKLEPHTVPSGGALYIMFENHVRSGGALY